MTEPADRYIANFDVHPSVIFKLGEDLITDDVQALAELVKNSYDADADYAIVRINTTGSPKEYADDTGFIEIDDNGVGMSVDAIERGWLTVSNSMKRTFKAAGRTTAKGRTPLGDKGLGRLGAQRLGNRVTITTTPTGSATSHHLSFDWRDFLDYEALSEVKVAIETMPAMRKRGTTITISDLREPDRLADIQRLQIELSKVVSPYYGVAKFKLRASLNGQTVDLTELDAQVRNSSVVRYRLAFDGATLSIRGRMKLAHLRPNSKKDRPDFDSRIASDRGDALLRHLASAPYARDVKLGPSTVPGWWIEFSNDISLEEVRPVLESGSPASPGPFEAEVDLFNLSAGTVEDLGVFDSLSDLRRYIQDLHGIRIYRDGFNVRVDDDWLGLGKLWSSGKSWYGMRPATTMGYLALTAAGNSQLVETTDREGFKRTPHYQNLIKLLGEFVSFTGKVQQFVGRGAVAFRSATSVGEPMEDTASMVSRLGETLNRADTFVAPLHNLRVRLEGHAAEADLLIDQMGDNPEADADELELLGAINKLSRNAYSAGELVKELEAFVGDVTAQQHVGRRLQSELEMVEEQLSLAYDTVAVGLTAEALSHEIANIAERLARRTSDIARHVKRTAPDDRKLRNFVEEVRGSIAGLRRQLAHLAPSLRYVRERRETLAMSAVAEEVRHYFEARWRERPLRLEVVIADDFEIVMNRGKILQVFDNLLLNSEYWLLEDVRIGRIDAGVVRIRIDSPNVTVEDNGRGVDPQLENSLFDAFATRKPRGSGRGLGLFIVRQLLGAEGCDIELLTHRNKQRRRYVFELDLSGVLRSG